MVYMYTNTESNLMKWLLHAVSGFIELVSSYYEENVNIVLTIHHPPSCLWILFIVLTSSVSPEANHSEVILTE